VKRVIGRKSSNVCKMVRKRNGTLQETTPPQIEHLNLTPFKLFSAVKKPEEASSGIQDSLPLEHIGEENAEKISIRNSMYQKRKTLLVHDVSAPRSSKSQLTPSEEKLLSTLTSIAVVEPDFQEIPGEEAKGKGNSCEFSKLIKPMIE